MTKPFRLMGSTGIHKGDREYQQDQVALLAHPRHNGCVLGVVADGMGGRSGGRKASDQVMLPARQLFERYSPDTDDAAALLKHVVQESHIVIRLTAIAAEQEPHSTVAAFVINPRGDCHWVHAGDSRIYHFRGGQMVHRTSDHSYVQALVDRGEITEAQALRHPPSNIFVGAAVAHAARGDRVLHRKSPLAGRRRRRQPVAGDREDRAAGGGKTRAAPGAPGRLGRLSG